MSCSRRHRALPDTMRLLLGAAAVAAAFGTVSASTSSPALADGQYARTQSFTGGATSWVVPDYVDTVHVHAVGGSGSAGRPAGRAAGGQGGLGGTIDVDIPVAPGQRLDIVPGDQATSDHAGSGWSRGGDTGQEDSSIYSRTPGHGNGGGSTAVTRDGTVLVVAGGGGGGGGAGATIVDIGGDGGNGGGHRGYAGHGFPAAAGGSGFASGQNGGAGQDAPYGSYSGAGGGGGAGYAPDGRGGGAGGSALADLLLSGVAGGGGAGGASYSMVSAAVEGVADGPGDGSVTISWNYHLVFPTGGTLTASANLVAVGTPITFTAELSSTNPAARYYPISGTVTIGTYDPATGVSLPQAYWDATYGPVMMWTSVLPAGVTYVWAEYSGDANHAPWRTTENVAVGVFAPLRTVTVIPGSLDFGPHDVGSATTETATITNTGGVEWTIAGIALDEPAFAITGGSCDQHPLAVAASCTFDITYSPTTAGSFGGTLALTDAVGNVTSIPLTGAATAVVTPGGPPPAPAAPTITRISPTSGPRRGGTRVTITGTNLVNVTRITFGSHPATGVRCPTDTTCTAVAPAGRGTVHVAVATPGGTSAATVHDRFRYH